MTSLMIDFDPKPHYFFEIEKKNYIIKIADSFDEIKLAQKLRHKVFSKVASGFTGEIDSDDFDYSADHLIVIDKSTNTVVGTYRFLLSDKVNKHYSEREFDLTNFLKLPGRKMELGRASVDPSARAGVIITLLWRGIAEYLKITKSDYLFGCSSIWGVGPDEIMTLCHSLYSKNLVSEVQALPLKSHWPLGLPNNIDDFNLNLESEKNKTSDFKMNIIYDQYVPTLVKTYIHVGAKFSVPPAYDQKLKTFEFFGFVETKNIDPAFKKKYL